MNRKQLIISLFKVWLGKVDVYDAPHDKVQILNNRLMNARSIYLLTKTKSIHIMFRMPSLFYQGRDHNNFIVDKPTKYNLFWVKVRKIKNKIKEML